MTIFKAHPVQQAMSAAAAPADLNEAGFRRNPGEPDAAQSEDGEYRKSRVQWRGLTIAIENPAGSVRRGRNRHGVSWEIRMRYDYGEVVGSMGVDGDPVDIYLGPHLEDAPMVYVVHQRRVNDWDAYDEDKAMAGFLTETDAAQAFLSNYNDPRFLGPITAMPVDEFVAKVRATREKPAMIKALFLKTHVNTYTKKDGTVVAAHEDKRAAAKPSDFRSPANVTETPQFKRWFGESKVVDASGKPLVVYHGSGSDFDEFDPSRLGSNTGYGDAEIGFHFSDNHADADHYASMAARKATGDHMASGVVRKFYLSLQNPLIVGMDEDDGNAGEKTQDFLDDKNAAKSYAEEKGHDGIIYLYGTNVDSGYTAIAFRPEQIKSATDNSGDFNPENRSIRKSLSPVLLFFKGYVGPYLRGGRIVNIAGYHGRSARATASPGQLSLFGSNEPLPPSPLKGKDPVASTPDLFDEPTHTEPTRELIAEHERLVDVLNSPSHADDKAEAKKQAAELAEIKGEAGEHKKLLIVNPRTSQENNSQIKKDGGNSNLSNNSPVEAKQESSMQSSKPLAPTNRGARVTPQVASDRQLDSMIKIAADSIDKLRRSDVDRVIGEAPAHFRSHVAGHIKSKRKDLADEVDDVMSELRSAQAS